MISFDICEGNPGALTFLMLAYQKWFIRAEYAFQKMDANNIRGEKLYILWNDCCGRDVDLAMKVMMNWPIDKITERINGEYGRGVPIEQGEADGPC